MLRTVPVTVLLLLVVGFGLLAGGCAPMTSSSAIHNAESALEAAEKEDAPRHARYTYWLARAYLRKAKLADGYSEFRGAEQFAIEAREIAVKAVADAKQSKLNQKILEERMRRKAPSKSGPR